ncbi:MAG TPA: hypothetical protein VG371_14495 [Solirubrobacteraceae bacterium]|nr:hypothetical protein [Solirubrobacteraceae bacterium]
MPLVLGFVALLGAALLLTSAVTDASFADVIHGKAGQLYKQHAASAPTTTTAAASSSSSSSTAPIAVNSAGYTNPIPGATVGRTDQGVDANLKAGDPIVALGKSKVVGILQNWYSGQPFVWLQLLNGPQAGKYWYVAEEINPTVVAGQVVDAGQKIGSYAASGTGLELGWATASGATLARATTGYSEGQATTAGQSFRAFLTSLGL